MVHALARLIAMLARRLAARLDRLVDAAPPDEPITILRRRFPGAPEHWLRWILRRAPQLAYAPALEAGRDRRAAEDVDRARHCSPRYDVDPYERAATAVPAPGDEHPGVEPAPAAVTEPCPQAAASNENAPRPTLFGLAWPFTKRADRDGIDIGFGPRQPHGATPTFPDWNRPPARKSARAPTYPEPPVHRTEPDPARPDLAPASGAAAATASRDGSKPRALTAQPTWPLSPSVPFREPAFPASEPINLLWAASERAIDAVARAELPWPGLDVDGQAGWPSLPPVWSEMRDQLELGPDLAGLLRHQHEAALWSA